MEPKKDASPDFVTHADTFNSLALERNLSRRKITAAIVKARGNVPAAVQV
jgi:hypothetical protein